MKSSLRKDSGCNFASVQDEVGHGHCGRFGRYVHNWITLYTMLLPRVLGGRWRKEKQGYKVSCCGSFFVSRHSSFIWHRWDGGNKSVQLLVLKIEVELIHLTCADVDIPVFCCCRRYSASRHKSYNTRIEHSFISLKKKEHRTFIPLISCSLFLKKHTFTWTTKNYLFLYFLFI